MTIRPARADDAAAICDFWNPFIRDTAVTFNSVEKSPEEVSKDILARSNGFFVATIDDRPVGFATFFQFRGGIGYRHSMEHTVILSPTAHGHGVGRGLMERLCAAARAQGAHSMIAGVSAENTAGHAFHARIGFAEVARIPQVGFKFGRWMDLILMQKFL